VCMCVHMKGVPAGSSGFSGPRFGPGSSPFTHTSGEVKRSTRLRTRYFSMSGMEHQFERYSFISYNTKRRTSNTVAACMYVCVGCSSLQNKSKLKCEAEHVTHMRAAPAPTAGS